MERARTGKRKGEGLVRAKEVQRNRERCERGGRAGEKSENEMKGTEKKDRREKRIEFV